METKDLEQRRKAVLAQVYENLASVEKKLQSEGYVVAGYGGNTYYGYVGEGNGFQGAALTPVTSRPVIFNSRKAAERVANDGTYRNGGGDVIALEVVEAATYFRSVYDSIKEGIKLMEDVFSK